MNTDKKLLLITAGPTGSGKTGLVQKTLEYLGYTSFDHKKFLIDDLVENSVSYTENVKEILEEVKRECEKKNFTKKPNKNPNEIDKCQRRAYANTDGKLIDRFYKAYSSSKNSKDNCKQNNNYGIVDEISIRNSDKKSCSDILDKKLWETLNDPNNTTPVVFETTGEKFRIGY